MCWSNSSGVVSSSVPRVVEPGGVDQAVDPAVRARPTASTDCLRLRDVGDVGRRRTAPRRRAALELRGERLARRSARRPVTATVAPSSTAARAMAAPTPWVPPLTRTTLSASSPIECQVRSASSARVRSSQPARRARPRGSAVQSSAQRLPDDLGLRRRGRARRPAGRGRGWSGTGSPRRPRRSRCRSRRPVDARGPAARAAPGRPRWTRGRGRPSPSRGRRPRRPAAGWPSRWMSAETLVPAPWNSAGLKNTASPLASGSWT